MLFNRGIGLSVIVNVVEVPVQPYSVGVTVIVATEGSVVVFVGANLDIFPVPFGPRPMLVLSLVQVYVAPVVPVKSISEDIESPLHWV